MTTLSTIRERLAHHRRWAGHIDFLFSTSVVSTVGECEWCGASAGPYGRDMVRWFPDEYVCFACLGEREYEHVSAAQRLEDQYERALASRVFVGIMLVFLIGAALDTWIAAW